jgi:hypothetical protein
MHAVNLKERLCEFKGIGSVAYEKKKKACNVNPHWPNKRTFELTSRLVDDGSRRSEI